VRDRLPEFGDAEVAVVLFTRPRNLRGYRGRFVAPLGVITDESRDVYRAFGLGRDPQPQDEPAGHEATTQQGGDFVIGRDGRLVYAFRSRDTDDRPSVDELLDAVRRA
jgi:peroxiredoxin